MNSLINAVEVKTMSSREIAELTGKRHSDVKRDIKVLLEQLGEGASKFAHSYLDVQNKQQVGYLLDKETTLCLVAGYNTKLRMKIIRRWQQLESQVSKPALPQNYIEAA